jgi:hypothetical protein
VPSASCEYAYPNVAGILVVRMGSVKGKEAGKATTPSTSSGPSAGRRGHGGAADAAIIEQHARRFHELLTPLYHVIPWGDPVVSPARFREVYNRTRELMPDFAAASPAELVRTIAAHPAALMVFRLMAGYTRGELSDILGRIGRRTVSATKIREMENASELAEVRGKPGDNLGRVEALAHVLHGLIDGTVMELPPDADRARFRTRRAKTDTQDGWGSVERCATDRLTYPDLLYERYTGRPFAYVRDALSEAKGDILEDALVGLFRRAGVACDQVRDNVVEGWEQAPDLFVPDREKPAVALEAKVAEDGGTARDKAGRIERLARMCREHGVLLVAAIDGKGFRRIRDVVLSIMRSTQGHTYTLSTIERILDIPHVRRLRGSGT